MQTRKGTANAQCNNRSDFRNLKTLIDSGVPEVAFRCFVVSLFMLNSLMFVADFVEMSQGELLVTHLCNISTPVNRPAAFCLPTPNVSK